MQQQQQRPVQQPTQQYSMQQQSRQQQQTTGQRQSHAGANFSGADGPPQSNPSSRPSFQTHEDPTFAPNQQWHLPLCPYHLRSLAGVQKDGSLYQCTNPNCSKRHPDTLAETTKAEADKCTAH